MCRERKMLQRVSTFQKQIDRKVEFGEAIIAKGVRALYWILKQEIPTVKVVSLLDLIEKLGINDLTPSVRTPPGRGGHGNQLMYGPPGPGGSIYAAVFEPLMLKCSSLLHPFIS